MLEKLFLVVSNNQIFSGLVVALIIYLITVTLKRFRKNKLKKEVVLFLKTRYSKQHKKFISEQKYSKDFILDSIDIPTKQGEIDIVLDELEKNKAIDYKMFGKIKKYYIEEK